MVNLVWILRFGVKTRELDGSHAENKIRKKCKIEPLEVLGYWASDSKATEGSSRSFPRVGEDDI